MTHDAHPLSSGPESYAPHEVPPRGVGGSCGFVHAPCDKPDCPSHGKLMLVPCDLMAAKQYVYKHHRHNLPPKIARFAVAIRQGGVTVGVGIAGTPKARALDNGVTLEILRSCTDGTDNANSMIYGALSRAAKALGWHKVVTYNLKAESGASLKAAGFVIEAELPHREGWDTPTRPRYNQDLFGNRVTPEGPKRRWARYLTAEAFEKAKKELVAS